MTTRPHVNDWVLAAACNGTDPNLFHPMPEGQLVPSVGRSKVEQRRIATAKAICATCPVGDECEAEGRRLGDWLSIRNGKLPTERTGAPRAKRDGIDVCGTDAGYRAHYRKGDRGDEVCGPCREAHAQVRAIWAQSRGAA